MSLYKCCNIKAPLGRGISSITQGGGDFEMMMNSQQQQQHQEMMITSSAFSLSLYCVCMRVCWALAEDPRAMCDNVFITSHHQMTLLLMKYIKTKVVNMSRHRRRWDDAKEAEQKRMEKVEEQRIYTYNFEWAVALAQSIVRRHQQSSISASTSAQEAVLEGPKEKKLEMRETNDRPVGHYLLFAGQRTGLFLCCIYSILKCPFRERMPARPLFQLPGISEPRRKEIR